MAREALTISEIEAECVEPFIKNVLDYYIENGCLNEKYPLYHFEFAIFYILRLQIDESLRRRARAVERAEKRRAEKVAESASENTVENIMENTTESATESEVVQATDMDVEGDELSDRSDKSDVSHKSDRLDLSDKSDEAGRLNLPTSRISRLLNKQYFLKFRK